MTELYPDGKRLWLSVCEVRGVDKQRAEIEWTQWEEGFLTRDEWQRVAESFTADVKVACWCETCRPITLMDMRMVLCATCGNKRCPRATDHRNVCTNSNKPGQPGSSYGGQSIPAAGTSGTSPISTAPPVNERPAMRQWQDTVRAVDLPPEDLALVIDTLIARLGMQVIREQTPDYTSYELRSIDSGQLDGSKA